MNEFALIWAIVVTILYQYRTYKKRRPTTPKDAVKNLAEELGFKEERIVDWLMNNLSFKIILFEKLFDGVKDVENYTAVQEPFTRNGKKPGGC